MLLRFFKFLSTFSFFVLHAAGVFTGWMAYALSSSHRPRMRENMKRTDYMSAVRTLTNMLKKSAAVSLLPEVLA